MTDLDLTKPLRFIKSKDKFFACLTIPVGLANPCSHGLYGYRLCPDGGLVPEHATLAVLENIPESLVRYIRVRLGTDTHDEVAAWFGSLYQSLPRKDNDPDLHPDLRGTALLKLTRTEDGKTHVEVIDG